MVSAAGLPSELPLAMESVDGNRCKQDGADMLDDNQPAIHDHHPAASQHRGGTNVSHIDSNMHPTSPRGKGTGGQDEQPASLTATQLDAYDTVAFSESVWDASVFLWHPLVGTRLSLLTSLIVFINIFMQLFFFYIVMENMLEPSVKNETLTDLLKFRVGIAHSMKVADRTTYQSMISQMCKEGGNDKIYLSAGQKELQNEIEQFQKNDFGLHLCILVQACWLGVIVKELIDVFAVTGALLKLPRGKTKIVGSDADGLRVSVQHVSRARLAWIALSMLIPRLACAGCLGWVGVQFLAATENMTDLVLNAVALTFIFELDELLFSILAPRRLKVILGAAEPLAPVRVPPGSNTVVTMMALAAGLVFIVNMVVEPFVWRLNMATNIMCGGDLHFVWAENPVTKMIHVTKTAQLAEETSWSPQEMIVLQSINISLEGAEKYGWDDINASVIKRAYERTEEKDSFESEAVVTDDSLFTAVTRLDRSMWAGEESFRMLLRLDGQTEAEASDSRMCVDYDFVPAVKAYLQVRLGDGFTCEQARWNDKCAEFEASYLRYLCPVSCGCQQVEWDNNYAGFFNAAQFGCPSPCRDLFAPLLNIGNGNIVNHRPALLPKVSSGGGGEWLARYMQGLQAYFRSQDHVDDRTRYVIRYGFALGVFSNICEFSACDREVICAGGYCDLNRLGDCEVPPDPSQLNSPEVSQNASSLAAPGDSADPAAPPGPADPTGPANPQTVTSRASQAQCVTADALGHYWLDGHLIDAILEGSYQLHPTMPASEQSWAFQEVGNATGCAFLTSFEFKSVIGLDLCDVGQYTSIRGICPEECRCQLGMAECLWSEDDQDWY